MYQPNQFFHPWHALDVGKDAPRAVQAIIEIQQGSRTKYELDKSTGYLRLDRILAHHTYPFHYGFIPQTYCPDNDPLDILIVCSEQLLPLSIVEARVIGAIKMIDNGQQDDKIIAVAANDPSMRNKHTLADFDQQAVTAMRDFFEQYKRSEGKEVVVEGFLQKREAQNIVQEAIQAYEKQFGKQA